MKSQALKWLRGKLAADEPTYGLWITLNSPSVTEMAVGLGLDWVVIDAEHGSLDWQDVAAHLRATVRSHTVALVRVCELNVALIKRALDIGADGVVIPFIETAEQLRQAVNCCRYPPEGVRGIGAERATGWGQCMTEHAAEANDQVLIVPILETVRAESELDRLCEVDGVDVFQIGPADFSASAGYRGQWEGPGIAERIVAMKNRLRHAGKQCGILATSDDNLLERREQGFRFLGLGTDAGLLLRSLTSTLQAAGLEHRLTTDLTPRENSPRAP